MLHELLLSLLGYTGDLVIDDKEHRLSVGLSPENSISDQCTFKLASDISFIQSSERDIIEKTITLGFYYRELDRFATKSRNLSWIRFGNEGSKKNQSVYRRAIANGLVEVLSVYRSAVLHVEQKLLSDPLPILATVTQSLNKFFVLLPPLYELILEIERDGISGGKLLNLLHKRCHCGVPELQTCIQRLLWHGHQVMYNQLASWMVYGILHDQYREFFICEQEGNSERDSSNMSEKLARMSVNDGSLSDWHLGFHITLDMLPEYILMHIAESILFAGKAIRVLRNPSSAFRSVDARHKKLMGDELLPQSEADKIESILINLKESSEFHKRSFEGAVDSIRAIAASHLWQLVVVRADLNGHLKAIKDYFLLAKGDFFQTFLEESRQLMRLPPRQSTAEADLMVPFRLVDVIESQWNVLQTHIEESRDFAELGEFHQEYLSALISQSFLDIGSVSRILDGIMKLCLQFCWKIENQETNASTNELERITEEFNKKSNSLYTILRSSRLAGSQRPPFFASKLQFLL